MSQRVNCINANTYSGGWINRDDIGIDNKFHQLKVLKKALTSEELCGGMRSWDLELLIRTNPDKNGTLRLAVAPDYVLIDESVKIPVDR